MEAVKPVSKFRDSESYRPGWSPDDPNVQWDLDCSISLSLKFLICATGLTLFYLPLETVVPNKSTKHFYY